MFGRPAAVAVARAARHFLVASDNGQPRAVAGSRIVCCVATSWNNRSPRHLMADPELIQPPERRLHGSSAIEQDALEQVAYRPEQGYDQL